MHFRIITISDLRCVRKFGAQGGNRTPTPLLAADFKSAASTFPPPGLMETLSMVRRYIGPLHYLLLGGRMEATGGFEPPNRAFAELRLNHLATSPRRLYYHIYGAEEEI